VDSFIYIYLIILITGRPGIFLKAMIMIQLLYIENILRIRDLIPIFLGASFSIWKLKVSKSNLESTARYICKVLISSFELAGSPKLKHLSRRLSLTWSCV
jgi:hypothetical protein